ncbi:MAG TPA: glycosyltransferase [Bryobacteraceae bacterium]|nr:glycosyltransferase [Bryobacteraceae bacterium]
MNPVPVDAPIAPTQQAAPVGRLNILSLSTVYPSPLEPGLGLFVRDRLAHMARLENVKVIAPLPVIDYGLKRVLKRASIPHSCQEGPVEVLRPSWFYPPGGTPATPAALFLRLLGLVLRLRRRFPIDVIDAHFAHPEGVAAALLSRALGCSFTITLRGSEPVFSQSRLRRECIAWAVRRASRIVAVSRPLADFAVELGASRSRVAIIPNGIDTTTFHPRDRSECRTKHGIPADGKLVLSAGELIEAKGHHMVIQAVHNLAERGITAQAIIAGGVGHGGRPYDRELRQLVADLGLEGSVRFTGWLNRESLAELAAAADVLCLASYTEGWPNVVHEALACGTPVVASAVGSVPDLIPSERYGLVVPARNQDALTNALCDALRRSWNRAEIASWGQARSWGHVADEVVAVMRQAVQQASAAKSARIEESRL